MKTKHAYDFTLQQLEWMNIPIDDVGYYSSSELLNIPSPMLKKIVVDFEKTRYDKKGYRNYKNKWRELLKLDSTKGKTIMDYGCGFGIESLQFARNNNKVIIADINKENVELAQKVLKLMGFSPFKKVVVKSKYPFFGDVGKIDIFYSNGVLHHIPYPKKIIKRACEILKKNGEIRLMVYSDKLWELATNEKLPPIELDIRDHPRFLDFVRVGDSVGYYADWYNKEKIEKWFGDYAKIITCDYFTPDKRFLAVRLEKRS